MLRRAMVAVLALGLLAGCSGDAGNATDRYDEESLRDLLLARADAPAGTELDAGSSGAQSLEEFAGDDELKETQLRDAGFRTSYFRVFASPAFFAEQPEGVLAISYALLFADDAGARRSLRIIADAVQRDGEGVAQRPAPSFGSEAYVLSGTLERGLPPGFLYAWRTRNVMLGLVVAGSEGAIDEDAAERLARRMYTKGR